MNTPSFQVGKDITLRPRINCQPEFDFQRSNLKLTNAYYEKYEAVSGILDENLRIGNFANTILRTYSS